MLTMQCVVKSIRAYNGHEGEASVAPSHGIIAQVVMFERLSPHLLGRIHGGLARFLESRPDLKFVSTVHTVKAHVDARAVADDPVRVYAAGNAAAEQPARPPRCATTNGNPLSALGARDHH